MATIQSKGIFLTLVAQLDRLARHNRQGSFRTKARYYEACKRFCAYLAAEYHLQKLENISGKHLVSYVLYLQDTGKSASTVKTDLAAIRFFHDKMSRPKYTLPTNSELDVGLERRRFGQLDRTWSGPEFNRLLGRRWPKTVTTSFSPSTLGAMQDFVSTSVSVWTPQRRSRHCAKTSSP